MAPLITNAGDSLTFDHSVPATIRTVIGESKDIYCQMCGILPGDIDEYKGRKARFLVSIVPNNGLGLRSVDTDVRILCSTCNQGAKNITGEKPTAIWLLSQIRRAGLQEQKAVFEWLTTKFGKQG